MDFADWRGREREAPLGPGEQVSTTTVDHAGSLGLGAALPPTGTSPLGNSSSSNSTLSISPAPARALQPIVPWPRFVARIRELSTQVQGKHILSKLDGSTILPSGFIPVHTYRMYRSSPLHAILRVPNVPGRAGEVVLALDEEHVHLLLQGGGRQREALEGGLFPALAGVMRWVYLAELRLYVVATSSLELKVLNNIFAEVHTLSVRKPTLHLSWIPEQGMVVCGSIGYVSAYRITA
jgi:hypothetical protein